MSVPEVGFFPRSGRWSHINKAVNAKKNSSAAKTPTATVNAEVSGSAALRFFPTAIKYCHSEKSQFRWTRGPHIKYRTCNPSMSWKTGQSEAKGLPDSCNLANSECLPKVTLVRKEGLCNSAFMWYPFVDLVLLSEQRSDPRLFFPT